jgi:hypothetical protein
MIAKRAHDLGWVLGAGLYVCAALQGISDVVSPDNGLLYLLVALAFASLTSQWCVIDSRRMGQPMLHIVQMITFCTWPVAVPIYLVSSRRLRGVGVAVLHGIGLLAVAWLSFLATVLALYGP